MDNFKARSKVIVMASGKTQDISVIVAAYNEEPVILKNLHRIVQELSSRPEIDWEIICVNDGSQDRTGELMDEFAAKDHRVHVLHHRRNFGQGRALRTGFDCCRGDIIVTLDADLSYGPEYIFRLADALDKNTNVEIALASPYTKGGTVRNVPSYRYILSRFGNFYLARMSHYPISTSTCVARAYRREVLDNLSLTSDGMELQLEILMKSSMMGFRVCEVPAHLEWADDKVAEADFRRVSKMRILRTIRLYLLMGWLFKPASVFILLSLLLILPGAYMALILSLRTASLIWKHLPSGFLQAISLGLQEVFATYTYSLVFCGGFLLIGIQIFAFALLVLQNKYYFEEIYRIGLHKKHQHSSDVQ
jgi:glycosyltransferase involved in cell wall biosynthesis